MVWSFIRVCTYIGDRRVEGKKPVLNLGFLTSAKAARTLRQTQTVLFRNCRALAVVVVILPAGVSSQNFQFLLLSTVYTVASLGRILPGLFGAGVSRHRHSRLPSTFHHYADCTGTIYRELNVKETWCLCSNLSTYYHACLCINCTQCFTCGRALLITKHFFSTFITCTVIWNNRTSSNYCYYYHSWSGNIQWLLFTTSTVHAIVALWNIFD